MNTALYLEHVAGVAGNMFAASFIDAGLVSAQELQELPKVLQLTDVKVVVKDVFKASLNCTHVDVLWESEKWKKDFARLINQSEGSFTKVKEVNKGVFHDSSSHWHMSYKELDFFLQKSLLDSDVNLLSRKIFKEIALAEAASHGTSLDEVSFHEVGAVDSILDVVMAAYCLNKVKAKKYFSSPIRLGRGLVQMAHGTHPIPPPASSKLCQGMLLAKTPDAITRENVELSTPTGLAIIKVIDPVFITELPEGYVSKTVGSGAGSMDLGAYPNIFRLTFLEERKSQNLDSQNLSKLFRTESVYQISCNLDDETPEKIGWLCESLLEKGALDVWVQTGLGKKSRMLHELQVLTSVEFFEEAILFLLEKSSSFGVRFEKLNRFILDRKIEERVINGKTVRYKVGYDLNNKKIKEKPEFDDFKKTFSLN